MDKVSFDNHAVQRYGEKPKVLNKDVMFKPSQHMFSTEINNYFNTEGNENPAMNQSQKRSLSKNSF